MTIIIKFNAPTDNDVVKIFLYKSSSETGTYTKILESDAKDINGNWITELEDPNGSYDDWYKISFIDSMGIESDLSDPIQGTKGVKFGYTTMDKIWNILKSDLDDTMDTPNNDLWSRIKQAMEDESISISAKLRSAGLVSLTDSDYRDESLELSARYGAASLLLLQMYAGTGLNENANKWKAYRELADNYFNIYLNYKQASVKKTTDIWLVEDISCVTQQE